MPRDGSGQYQLPAGNPVVTNTIIASAWANNTMSDIAAQLNNVFTRDGTLGPTGPFKLMDGTVAAPGLAFNSEPGLGWYRFGTSGFGTVAQGATTSYLNSVTADQTTFSLSPRANGITNIVLSNQVNGAVNANYFSVLQYADGSAAIRTDVAGSATRGNLNIDAPQINFANSGGPTSGWQKLNNGLIIQWGTVAGSGNVPFNYPIAFPTACISIVLTPQVDPAAAMVNAWAYSVGGMNKVGATVVKRFIGGTSGPSSAGESAFYVAIGY
jgi:hypothetical protein